MAVLAVCLVLFLAMAVHSSATFCICKDGLSDPVLQKDIDYACGAGADCSPITQNGACYSPNTVKAHCDYAVNSYFQRKGQAVGSCDFSGTATQSPTAPNQSNGCAYPSTAGSTTPSTSTPGTPSTNTPGTPSTTTPSTTTPSTGTGTTPSTTTPYNGGTNTGTGTGTGTTSPSVFGLGPTGSGITSTDSSGTVTLQPFLFFCSYTLTLLFSGYVCLRV